MFRILLLAAVLAVATPHGYHSLYTYLLPSDIAPALSLVRSRYVGISQPCAYSIIEHALTHPHNGFLGRINLSFPSLRSQRLGYLRTLFSALPSQVFYTSYIDPVSAALGARGIHLPRYRLVDSLALSDYFLGLNAVRPVSTGLFSQFYTGQLLGLTQPFYNSFTFPAYSTILGRLSSYGFPGQYFAPLVSVFTPYTGLGHQLLPIFSGLGVRPSLPAITLPGVYNYYTQHNIAIPSFVARIRGVFNSLYQPVSYASVRSYGPGLGFITQDVFEHDLIPALYSRYYAFPSGVRQNLFLHSTRARFAPLATAFFKDAFTGNLLTGHSTYSTQFVSQTLESFDTFCRGKSDSRYSGSFWNSGILGGIFNKLGKLG
nr:CP52k-like protein 1 [Conchoderma hunteri]